MIIDLHTHTTASDGTDTPAELVAAAQAQGIDVVAITDHDTTGGWDEARTASPDGLTLVLGAEYSCVYRGATEPISLHLLGYVFDPEHEGLRAERDRLRADRVTRGERIVERMVTAGVPISWERVQEVAGGGAVGRPHIGRVLVENGVVDTVGDAFRELLGSSSPYYIPTADTDVFDALRLVQAAGGVAVFAHPLARRRGLVVDDEVIAAFAAAGLTGIEVDHPDHGREDRAHLAGLAGELGLIATGSSDYHGRNKPTSLAACTTAPEAYEALFAGSRQSQYT